MFNRITLTNLWDTSLVFRFQLAGLGWRLSCRHICINSFQRGGSLYECPHRVYNRIQISGLLDSFHIDLPYCETSFVE